MSSAAQPDNALPRSKGRLLRILGTGFGVSLVIGDTVGAGILRTPGYVAAQLQSSWLVTLAWALGGVYALFCTVAVIELSTTLPRAGGWFLYSRRAFGDYAGFLVGCCDWMIQLVAIGYLAVAFGEFANQLAPQIGMKLAAVSVVVVLAWLNWLGLRLGSRVQEFTSAAKALALAAFVGACIVLPSRGAPQTIVSAIPRPGGLLVPILLAFQAIIVTYDGWYGNIYFVEEDVDPSRNLPRSAISGVLACVAIFVLVNVALLHVLSSRALAGSEFPVADAAMSLLGRSGREAVLILGLVTVVSTINATLLITPRIVFGMGRDGLLPTWAASVNRGGTPATALGVSAIVSLALIVSGTYESLIAISSFLLVGVYLSGFVSLFVLRRRQPNLPRPFRAWGYPWTTLVVILSSVAFLIVSIAGDVRHSLFTLALTALTVPAFLLIKKRGLSR